MGVAAPVLGFVGTGLSMIGGMQSASMQAAGYRHAEAQAQIRALNARTAADQTSAFMRDELQTTLGNIYAIRAAAGAGSSPTEMALVEREREESERQRLIKTGNLRSQASASENDAAFYRYAAGSAMQSGMFSALGRGLSGFSGIRL